MTDTRQPCSPMTTLAAGKFVLTLAAMNSRIRLDLHRKAGVLAGFCFCREEVDHG
jgi:hypothetical protein